MEKTNNKRNVTIDVLRGIAVIAVIIGHSIQRGMVVNYYNSFFKIIYTFHMPLFMLLSGYSLQKFSKQEDCKLILKRFLRLIIPTFVWSYIIYFMRNFDFVGIKEFVYFPSSVIEYTKSLIMQPTYIIWFLYATFFCDLFIFLQNKIVRNNNTIIKICASIIIEIILIVLPQQYFGINVISYYFPIFCFGYYISIYFDKIKQYIKYLVLPSLIFYIYLFQYYNFGYSSSIINYSIALFGIIILYYLVSLIKCKKIINFFQYFGKRSLEFYLCQCVCLNIGIGSGKLRVVSIFISAMIVSNCLVYITNKFKISRMILYGKFEDKGGTKK